MNWMYENSVLGTYEIENADKFYLKSIFEDFEYVDTSICYNNDYLLGRYLNKRNKIISKIPPQMINEYEFMISNHLRCLKRSYIDIMLIHNSRSDWRLLAERLNKDKRFKSIGVSNFTIEQIEEYKSIIGEYPKYNEMEINPLYYDKELINFCKDKGIKIIAYAILGGKYNARKNISRFTHPYLLQFAGFNSNLVILRSDNLDRVNKMKNFLDNMELIVKNINYNLFNIESSTDKSIIPDKYSYPEYYTRLIYPTNSDKIHLITGMEISSGYESEDSYNLKDDLGIVPGDFPKYEFVSDYRVYFRYKLDEKVHEITGEYPIGGYSFPSTYSCIVKEKYSISNWLFKKRRNLNNVYIVSLNILDEKTGKLSKIYNENYKLLVESLIIKN